MDKTKVKSVNSTNQIDDSNEDLKQNNGYMNEQPPKKLIKLDAMPASPTINIALNKAYQKTDNIKCLHESWVKKSNNDTIVADKTSIQICTNPFQIGLLPNLLQTNKACKALVDEMVNKVQWSRKQMDLYEFYQSTDLSNMSNCPLLTSFLQMLRREMCPILEKITEIKLDYVSASCSMYTCGDYLLVHDDLLKDRQIAFIYYLTPWGDAETWRTSQGGCLEIFESDEQGLPQFPVKYKIAPTNNQFAFFKVGARSFHQVGEVTTFDYPRLTINGWFHGATNHAQSVADSLRLATRLQFKQPTVITTLNKKSTNKIKMINQLYVKPSTRRSIQKRVEDNSEICLYEFFNRDVFESMQTQLLQDLSLKWRRQGPANAQNYETLDMLSAHGIVKDVIELFESEHMFKLLRDYTDLDLYGADAITPTCSVELQRWKHGNYTVLGDGAISQDNTLDLIYYLNSSEGAGVITYLTPDTDTKQIEKNNSILARNAHALELDDDKDDDDDANDDDEEDNDESVLLTITPVDNALNLVYRCEGTTKFTKYVSYNTPLDKGPVFVISCSYKE